MKMKKGKLTMTISIGCTALILTMIIFTQFKTVDETDITAIETMRESELRAELANWKTKYEELDEKVTETRNKIDEYKAELANNANSTQILQNEISEAEMYLGYTKLKGEGIEIVLKDSDEGNIYYSEVLELVNQLNEAGAEAISINDERVVSTTEITLVGESFIFVNTKKMSSPYVIKAIGNKKYLESAITTKGGYIDKMNKNKKEVEYTLQDELELPAYDGKISFEKAKINKEEVK